MTGGTASAIILAPAPIIGTGRPDRYKNAAGRVVPSVTTITKRFADATGLINWSYRNGYRDGAEQKPEDPNAARDEAADAGHITHAWIVDSVAGRALTPYPFTDEETIGKAQRALEAFHAWAAEVSLVMLAVEIPLVHSELHYGGTLDGVGLVRQVPRVLDWKSGNRIYAEHLVQVAGYRELLRDAARQHKLDVPIPEDAALIRLDKNTGTPHTRLFDSDAVDLGWQYFHRIRDLYEMAKDVEKMVAPPKAKRSRR